MCKAPSAHNRGAASASKAAEGGAPARSGATVTREQSEREVRDERAMTPVSPKVRGLRTDMLVSSLQDETPNTPSLGTPGSPATPLFSSGKAHPSKPQGCMSRVCNREGIVWAKISGYRHWPAQIVDPSSQRATSLSFQNAKSYKQETDDTLVTFFGTHDVAWLRKDKAIRPWKAGLKRRFHIVPKRKKSFHAALLEVQTLCGAQNKLSFARI
eukprot:IDg8568t1